jgi:putative endopeptidase
MSMKPGIEESSFDHSIRAQDDLFRHVNGTWFKENQIPEDKSMYGSFHMLADDAEAAVKEILLEASANTGSAKSQAAQQIGDMYASFMDEERANQLGAAPIAAELELVKNLETIEDATKLMGEFSKMGIGGIFGSYVDNDSGNPKRYIVHLYQGGIGLPDEAYYREEKHAEIRDAYLPHIAQMLNFAGWEMPAAEKAAHTIMEFETALAAVHWNNVDARDAEKTYNLVSFADLQKLTPSFNWELWLAGGELQNKVLAETVVMMPSFFEGLDKVFNQKNLEQIKLWLAWKVIGSAASLLSENFVNERFAFYGTKLTGAPVNRARWKRGVSLVEGSLGELIGQIYVEKHFPMAAKKQWKNLFHI